MELEIIVYYNNKKLGVKKKIPEDLPITRDHLEFIMVNFAKEISKAIILDEEKK